MAANYDKLVTIVDQPSDVEEDNNVGRGQW